MSLPEFRPAAPAAGFTLLEAIVAFAIVASTLAALYGLIGQGTRSLAASEDRMIAALLADSELARATVEDLAAGTAEAVFDNRFRIRSTIAPERDLDQKLRATPFTAVAIEVSVTRAGESTPLVKLATLRIRPRETARAR